MATGPTANRPLTKTFCARCQQVFTPKDAMQIYQEKYYHPACFCCSSCGNTLAGKPFYPKPNNQFQCETCNHALAPNCCVCNQKIQSGTAAKRYQERHYHSNCFRCCKCTAVIPDGHNFVDMLDGRFQCLTCSKHITGSYQGKEHAPHMENILGEIEPVQCDQAGRIPICDKCARPVPSNEEAFRLETRYYHLECARCNRCRKKLFKVPCRKLGSALVCHTCS
ncbi:unnamed protein product [Adineta steineri]|uniref:LIM zinc-binding domain-containing protein n=1 Tax=Adineta steineri TaxID=433720 RepID=A0A813UJP2_9BILA|nr:unnamed protein product [Adineta steineri]CAF1008462.1 unnamed protein product [Adineta steineri]CAF1017753.1 unnamed protein product [Adineta steineri]